MRLLLITTLFLFAGTNLKAQSADKATAPTKNSKGVASFYHDKFEGRKTATGEIFDNDKFTAASNQLKLGSYVKVTNLSNGEVIYVRINDRMAKSNHRLIDLASIAAKKLAFHKKGLAKVQIDVVSAEEGKQAILAQLEAKKAAAANTL